MSVKPNDSGDFVLREPFELVSGEILPRVTLRYAVYGELNEARDNAILVFHALTGSAQIHEWWTDLIGAEKAFDTSRFCFVCANVLGSCYGSTGAREIQTIVTTRDMVRSQIELLNALQIEKVRAAIGGSLGGLLALQLATDFPERLAHSIVIGAAPLSALGLALNHLQREAVKLENGVSLARQIAMISYKSKSLFDQKFARLPNRNGENPARSLHERFDIAGYLDYQGSIFTKRFYSQAYNLLSKAMDLFDLSVDEIKRITARVSLVGISSDWLFPAEDVRNLSEKMLLLGVAADYHELISDDGHDAFLSDSVKMSEILKNLI